MDYFEQIVAKILDHQGYWTKIGYKLVLNKEEKRLLEKPSMPRPEVDIVAFRPGENLLLWVECKSYLDSGGVRYIAFTGEDNVHSKRFKIFNNKALRDLLANKLVAQLLEQGLLQTKPELKFCLVTGKIVNQKDRQKLRDHFKQNEWFLYDEFWVKKGLLALAKTGYDNDVAVLTAKLFNRIGEDG
jgi:hypothetical protein